MFSFGAQGSLKIFFLLKVNIWKSLTKDKLLAEFTLQHLLKKITVDNLTREDKDKYTCQTLKVANHEALAAILALTTCFESKEMESIIDSEFADIFVPLLLAMASYCGLAESTSKSSFQLAFDCLQVIVKPNFCDSGKMLRKTSENVYSRMIKEYLLRKWSKIDLENGPEMGLKLT